MYEVHNYQKAIQNKMLLLDYLLLNNKIYTLSQRMYETLLHSRNHT